nr:hypothetical protein [Tanacetum cinerariifolium]
PSTFKPQKSLKPRRKQRKEAETSHDESEDEDYVLLPSSDLLPSGGDSSILNELMVFYTSLQEQKDSLGAQEDASKQGRMIKEIDQNVEIALDDGAQGRTNDDEIAAPTTDVTKDKITMAQALAALKSVKPTIPTAATTVCYPNSKSQREDLEVLWAIVKDKFKKEKPVDDMDNILFKTLKTMFEHHVEDTIWTYQQGLAKVKNCKLFESCGVYCITMQSTIYYLLVKKVYPLTRNTLHQLWSDVRLQVDYNVEMAYDLLRFIRKQLMEGYTPQ